MTVQANVAMTLADYLAVSPEHWNRGARLCA